MSTIFPKQGTGKHSWFLVDVKGKVLGRAAARVAFYLRGKEKPDYTPNLDQGNFIVVVNAKDLVMTGNKMDDKFYAHHTGYPSGLKVKTLKQVLEKNPTKAFYEAVKGMMPKNRLGDMLFKKLRVYADDKHVHVGQNPQPLDIDPSPKAKS